MARELSGVPFIRALIPSTGAPPSQPHHVLGAPPPTPFHDEVRITPCELGGDTASGLEQSTTLKNLAGTHRKKKWEPRKKSSPVLYLGSGCERHKDAAGVAACLEEGPKLARGGGRGTRVAPERRRAGGMRVTRNWMEGGMCPSAPAAVAKHLRPRGMNSRHIFVPQSGGWKARIKVLAGLFSPEASLLGLQTASHCLAGAPHGLPSGQSLPCGLCVQISSLYEDAGHTGLVPNLTASFQWNHLLCLHLQL